MYPEKTTDMSQVNDKLYHMDSDYYFGIFKLFSSHNIASISSAMSRIRTHNVSGDRH
jgi:negative regulator of genetic competence, sporulation and motility